MKTSEIILWIVLIALIGVMFVVDVERDSHYLTRDEIIVICDSLIRADSLTVLQKQIEEIRNSGFYLICQIITGQAKSWELYPTLHKLALWNAIRINEFNKKRK